MRPTDTGAIQPVLPVKEYVIPPDGADVHEQGWIEARLARVPGAKHPIDLRDLPVDNGGEDQDQTTRRAHLLLKIPRTNMTLLGIVHVARQGIQLLAFERSAPEPSPHARIAQKRWHPSTVAYRVTFLNNRVFTQSGAWLAGFSTIGELLP
jgi:hypothetical protein